MANRSEVSSGICVNLPIDGLAAALDDALAEIAEIESRRGSPVWRQPAEIEQCQRLQDAKDYLIRAQRLVNAYAKGPTV